MYLVVCFEWRNSTPFMRYSLNIALNRQSVVKCHVIVTLIAIIFTYPYILKVHMVVLKCNL